MNKPQPLDSPDFTLLRKAINRYLDRTDCGHCDCDCEHYIFEAAIVAVYGTSVWEYISSWYDLNAQ